MNGRVFVTLVLLLALFERVPLAFCLDVTFFEVVVLLGVSAFFVVAFLFVLRIVIRIVSF